MSQSSLASLLAMGFGVARGSSVRSSAIAGSMLLLCACASDTAARPAEQATLDAGGGKAGEADKADAAASQISRDKRPALCERDRGDNVRDVFCADEPPEVRSLADLQSLLHAVPGESNHLEEMYGSKSFVTLLSHSTSLFGQSVSAINPRMIVIGEGLVMAFQRGVQKVEVIAAARNPGYFNFYLFQFQQACNESDEGCGPGDLFTPQVEQDWLRVTLQDDEDLKNTPSDCRQCHQRGVQLPRLLMRELESPWTHFMQPFPADRDKFLGPGIQGPNLLQDYLDAKGDEHYGSFAADSIVSVAPFVLESFVKADQPVLFDAPGIENERYPYNSDTGAYPETARPSPTWEDAYAAFKTGDQLALPYIEPRVTDPHKLKERVEAYRRYRDGELSQHELPDFADIFSDDPMLRARIGLQTEPGATAEDALIQACGSCHNSVLDQEISRARFNIDLWKLDRAEIALAIERIERAPGSAGVMPPPEARQLDKQTREQLLDYLRNDPLSLAPDKHVQRAAVIGMAGGAERRASLRR